MKSSLLLLTATAAAVLLAGPAPAAWAKRVTVVIEDLRFTPAEVTVEPGDTVEWVNRDVQDHTVTADDGSFDSGRVRSGRRYEHTFDKPGKVPYGDDLHPRMRGTVVVRDKK